MVCLVWFVSLIVLKCFLGLLMFFNGFLHLCLGGAWRSFASSSKLRLGCFLAPLKRAKKNAAGGSGRPLGARFNSLDSDFDPVCAGGVFFFFSSLLV